MMLGPNLFFVTVILGIVWSGVKGQQSEDDPLIDERIGLPMIIIATTLIILILIIIFVITVVCILRQKRQQRLNSDQRHNYTHFCHDSNGAMDQEAFDNSIDQIKYTFKSGTVELDPVEKDVSCNGTTVAQAVLFADNDSTQHSTDVLKALVGIRSSCEATIETCLNENNNAQTHKSMTLDHSPMDTEVPTKSIALSDELKETDKVQRDVHADCSEGDVDDSPCQPDAVNIDSQYVCESALQDYSIKPFITSTENVDGSLSFFNDSCYEGSDPPNQSSSAANLTSSPANSPISPTPRSLDLVAIYIPFDDAEDQGNSESVYNPLLMDTATAVHNAQNADDVKEVNTKQLQTHAPTTQESQTISSTKETVEVHSLSDDTNNAIENFDTDIIRTKGLSPVISDSEDILELPLTKKISPRKSISVTINIPQAGSGGMPTLAENTGTYDQYIYPNCVESIELQRNPAYVTISDGCTNGTIDEVVKLERNPAYVTISDQCTNGIIDEAIILERNPAYIPIDHTSSEIHLYEEIPYTTAPITSTSSNTSDATIKMEKNPAYHCTTINYAGSLIQKHSTK